MPHRAVGQFAQIPWALLEKKATLSQGIFKLSQNRERRSARSQRADRARGLAVGGDGWRRADGGLHRGAGDSTPLASTLAMGAA